MQCGLGIKHYIEPYPSLHVARAFCRVAGKVVNPVYSIYSIDSISKRNKMAL